MLKKVLLFTALAAVCFIFIDQQHLFTSTFAQENINELNEPIFRDEQSRNLDRQLAQTIRQLTNRSWDGLVETKLPEGGTLVDLEGRFQNVMLARLDTDGEPVAACVTDLNEANHFFGRNLETGETVSKLPIEKESLAARAARHGMSEQEFSFYTRMINDAIRQEQLARPASSNFSLVTSGDAAGEGFNSTAAVAFANEGGNTGTNLGQQRQILFNFAAQNVWGSFLDSAVPIRINATFDSKTPCSSSGGVLGSAGAAYSYYDFPNAQYTNTDYHIALAEKQYGFPVLASNENQINASFNSDIDTGCLGAGTRFYYGLDANEPAGTVNLLVVLLHELGHGLGFSSFVTGTSGVYASGRPDVYSRFMLDEDTNKLWIDMTAAERMASALNNENVVWNGANVRIASPTVPMTAGLGNLSGTINMFTPAGFQQGSSISHFSTSASPNLLMEPVINDDTQTTLDLTRQQMRDIGWYRDTTNDTVRDQITTVLPNSGLAIINSSKNITWTNIGGFNKNVTIELSTNGGATYPTVIAASALNTGAFAWTVPNSPTTQARIRVREVGFSDPAGVSSSNFTIATNAPTAAGVPIDGRVSDASGRGIANAIINLTDINGNIRTARTNAFGYYHFREIPSGETYFADVKHKRFQFITQVINLNEAIELNFTPMFK